jgi:hypothetical protein
LTQDNARVRETRRKAEKPRWRSNLAISILIIILLATGIGLWTTQNYLWRFPASSHNSPPRALLLDQLSLNYPDPAFVSNVTGALATGGYQVDYSPPGQNAIDFFRQLPTKGYDLIIIRAHAGGDQSIITTETYSQSKYTSEQRSGTLVAAEVTGLPLFFAVTPRFVRQDMQGRFPGSTIVVMGCAALQGTQDLASAFLDKGANFFVGWDGSVTIIHTDTSTVRLARLLASGKSVPEATVTAGTADPVYGARLEYLNWSTLTQGRINNLTSQLMVWLAIGSILVLGPLAVFAVPRLFDLIDRVLGKTSRHGKTNSHAQNSQTT